MKLKRSKIKRREIRGTYGRGRRYFEDWEWVWVLDMGGGIKAVMVMFEGRCVRVLGVSVRLGVGGGVRR